MVKVTAVILSLALGLQMALPSQAIAQPLPPNQQQANTKQFGPRKQLATIIFAGLGGAILGLSTLSFYGRPQDNLSNIAIGFAVGVIGGTVYTTYQAATDPEKFYGPPPEEGVWRRPLLEQKEWDRLSMNQKNKVPGLGLRFEF